ncbi:uncharacterized protein [Montipora capricornis]
MTTSGTSTAVNMDPVDFIPVEFENSNYEVQLKDRTILKMLRFATMKNLSVSLFLVLLELVSVKPSLGFDSYIQGQEDKQSESFYKVTEGEALSGQVILVHQVSSELDCAQKCLLSTKCASYNFEVHCSRSSCTCELNAVSKTSSGDALQRREGFAYYEPVTIQMTQQEFAPTPAPNIVPTSVPQQGVVCESGWFNCSGRCVRIFDQHKQRSHANVYCQGFLTPSGDQGSLIKILSEDDNNRVVAIRSLASMPQGEYFIGLNDKALEGKYRWVDNTEALYTNWMQGYNQDISAEQNKDCVVMRMNHGDSNNGKWETKECNNNLRFICECPGQCTRR